MKSSRNHFVRLSFISARHFRRRSGRWFIENLCTLHHFHHLLIQSTSSSLIHLVSFALNIVILLLLVASFFGERNYERSFNGAHLFRNLKFISFGGPLLEERSAILMQNSKKIRKDRRMSAKALSIWTRRSDRRRERCKHMFGNFLISAWKKSPLSSLEFFATKLSRKWRCMFDLLNVGAANSFF